MIHTTHNTFFVSWVVLKCWHQGTCYHLSLYFSKMKVTITSHQQIVLKSSSSQVIYITALDTIHCSPLLYFLESCLHLYGTFLMFGCVLLTLLPISYIILPETKDISLGKSLNFIELKFLGFKFNLSSFLRTHRAAFSKKISTRRNHHLNSRLASGLQLHNA